MYKLGQIFESVLSIFPWWPCQQYSEWKKGAVDVCLPEVHVSLMDHLSSFSTVVTEVTQELCGRLLSTYTLRLQGGCRSGESGNVYILNLLKSRRRNLSFLVFFIVVCLFTVFVLYYGPFSLCVWNKN